MFRELPITKETKSKEINRPSYSKGVGLFVKLAFGFHPYRLICNPWNGYLWYLVRIVENIENKEFFQRAESIYWNRVFRYK